METPTIPPLPTSPPARVQRGWLAWLGHLALLTGWLLLIIYVGRVRDTPPHARVPLHDAGGVLRSVAVEIVLFGVVCQLAWLFSRATSAEWRLRWRGGFGPVWRGVLYAVGLRVGTVVLAAVVVFALIGLGWIDAQKLRAFRPQLEKLLSVQALAHDRAFFWCVVTLLSATAGVVEEIWRAGMLAGLAGVFPRVFGARAGQWLAVVPVAVLFGLGHLYMGWPAVVMTGVVGLVLGAVMVWHDTIWDAVVGHALFDAFGLALLGWELSRNPHLLGQ